MMNMKVKLLSDTAKLPTRGSNFAAGYDLYLDTNCTNTIKPHETIVLCTGFSAEIPHGYFAAVFPRSGLSTRGLRLANCVAVIDEDYRGEWMIPLHNDTDKPMTVEHGERVAQFIVLPYQVLDFEEVDELSDTKRGTGGFGSSGNK